MSLFIGIIGLPNIGKSTLFNALTTSAVEAANYAFCTVDPNVGIVEVPDQRLGDLTQVLEPESATPTTIQFVDIAGLVRGASQGEGLGNQFLEHIRRADALLHLVRCFAEDDVVHVDGSVDPQRDIATVETELLLADLDVVQRVLPNLSKVVQSQPRSERRIELEALQKVEEALGRGVKAKEVDLTSNEHQALTEYRLLTLKPVLYVANVGESLKEESTFAALETHLGAGNAIAVSAQIEAELIELSAQERDEFLGEMGWDESGLQRLIKASYALLDLITFYTHANGKLQAWQLAKGTAVPQAAGRIHSDMEDGFIRAEVANWEALVDAGGWAALRDLGQVRTEGKEYQVADGDVIQVLFKKN
jgi:ribosome-binding ATPase